MSSKKPSKWPLEFNRTKASTSSLLSPPGFSETSIHAPSSKEDNPDLVVKKSWDVALGPIKQIPMNLFIMWMSGNSISIFPIMMVGMMFFRPIQALFAAQQTFKMIEGNKAFMQKVIYCLGNVICLGLAVYKCQVMGLLPTHASDWLAFVESPKRLEWSGGGMIL